MTTGTMSSRGTTSPCVRASSASTSSATSFMPSSSTSRSTGNPATIAADSRPGSQKSSRVPSCLPFWKTAATRPTPNENFFPGTTRVAAPAGTRSTPRPSSAPSVSFSIFASGHSLPGTSSVPTRTSPNIAVAP